MTSYKLYKRDSFLKNFHSFLLVSFFSNKQIKIVHLKDYLYKKGFLLKIFKTQALLPLLNQTLSFSDTTTLVNVNHGPLFLIKPKSLKTSLLNSLKNFDEDRFLNLKMSPLACFLKYSLYNKSLFNLKNKKKVEVLQKSNLSYTNILSSLKVNYQFLICTCLIYLNDF